MLANDNAKEYEANTELLNNEIDGENSKICKDSVLLYLTTIGGKYYFMANSLSMCLR